MQLHMVVVMGSGGISHVVYELSMLFQRNALMRSIYALFLSLYGS